MKNYIKTKIIFLLLTSMAVLGGCKKDENLSAPPSIKLLSVHVVDTIGIDVDTIYSAPTSVSADSGAVVTLTYEITSEDELQQTDVKVVGLEVSAQLINSKGATTTLTNNYNAKRSDFQTDKTDSFSLVLPRITANTSVIVQVFNEFDLTSSKTFTILKN